MKRFWALNLTAVALFVAGWIEGSVAYVFESDSSYITYLILGLTILGAALIPFDRRDSAVWLANLLMKLGFIGTMYGFMIALSGVDPARAADLNAVIQMVTHMVAGIATAITTTLVGLVGNVWLRTVLRLT